MELIYMFSCCLHSILRTTWTSRMDSSGSIRTRYVSCLARFAVGIVEVQSRSFTLSMPYCEIQSPVANALLRPKNAICNHSAHHNRDKLKC